MATAILKLHEIDYAHAYLVQEERSYQLDQEDVLGVGDFSFLRDEWVPDALWLGAVALFITEDGLDGDAIVARNQDPILTARAAGFSVLEIAEYAVLEQRGRLG